MNTKLSGAKLVLVPNLQIGLNKLPYIEDLRDRVIKYIDFFPTQYLPETTETGVSDSNDLYLTLADKVGNEYIHYQMPMERFDYTATIGVRQAIFSKISLQNSYITCEDVNKVGQTAALLFWYDLPEFSARNKSDNVIVDSISIPIITDIHKNMLPDEERMSGKRFRFIWSGSVATTPDYNTGIDYTLFNPLYLTCRKGSYNVLENVPVELLYQIAMIEKTTFANIIFDLQNSFITVGGAGTYPTFNADYYNKNLFLNLGYEK